MKKNPFTFGRPVENHEFFDRERETDLAIGFIRNLQNFSVIGERRIGKTSFLKHILSVDTLKSHGLDPQEYIAVYLGIDSLYKVTIDNFIGNIVDEVKKQTQIEIVSRNVVDTLKKLVEELGSDSRKLIIALDEFEIIAPIPNNLSNLLRSIFQDKNIMAITASQRSLGELFEEGSASPLFNIFGNITLELFSKEETRGMIKKSFHEGGKEIKKNEISFLAGLSGGNPFLIQVVGFHYYDKKVKRSEFENEMLYQVKDVFEGYWTHMSEEEKEFLLEIETSRNEWIEYNLKKRGFLINEKGERRIFSTLFERFLSTKRKTS